jgi:hypothetical protein
LPLSFACSQKSNVSPSYNWFCPPLVSSLEAVTRMRDDVPYSLAERPSQSADW